VFRSIFSLLLSVKDIYKYVSKGDKVIVMGGFVSAPVAVVAKLKGVDLYLHEQNKVMGLVNSVFAKMSKKVFLSFLLFNASIKFVKPNACWMWNSWC
jgi:UDP-N-acetylglucosamine--N-acetylmuramyl-(pentapeptide) pyrophosphoryl-undecaprenol N-acetylglucosamine transferase